MKSTVTLKQGMNFIGDLDGHQISVDAEAAVGGEDKGPRPKGLMLTSLAGCTAMDVISILRKMKLEPEAFSVDAEAEVTDEHPKVFKRIKLTYRIKGDVPLEKAQKAVDLSLDRYCGVTDMLRKAAPVESEIIIE
jgi:putative redox protein